MGTVRRSLTGILAARTIRLGMTGGNHERMSEQVGFRVVRACVMFVRSVACAILGEGVRRPWGCGVAVCAIRRSSTVRFEGKVRFG